MITLLRTTLHFWRTRPIWSAGMVVLVAMVMFSGPVACIVHCMLLDAAAHQRALPQPSHHQHGLHADHSAAIGPVCPGFEQHSEHGEHAEPSALTVAVVLPLVLLPQLLASNFRLLSETLRGASTTLPPPRRPPRLAHS